MTKYFTQYYYNKCKHNKIVIKNTIARRKLNRFQCYFTICVELYVHLHDKGGNYNSSLGTNNRTHNNCSGEQKCPIISLNFNMAG